MADVAAEPLYLAFAIQQHSAATETTASMVVPVGWDSATLCWEVGEIWDTAHVRFAPKTNVPPLRLVGEREFGDDLLGNG